MLLQLKHELQAGQHWALAHMPLRGEVSQVLTSLKRRSRNPQTRSAIAAAEEKLTGKGLRRYIVPSDLACVSRALKVCTRDHFCRRGLRSIPAMVLAS